MARVLAISSQVAYGPVGLTALVPPLQAKGHEVLAVPTVTLSNHPGHGPPAGFRTRPEDMRAIFAALQGLGGLAGIDAILTGYFASPEQVHEAAQVIRAINPAVVLVDPVIGDGEALYVPEAVAQAIRDLLLPLATIITPNRFELAWLTRQPVDDESQATVAARLTGIGEVLVTSVPDKGNELTTLLVTPGGSFRHRSSRLPQVPHGTGDFLSGAFLAGRLTLSEGEALAEASQRLDRAIAMSAGSQVLAIAYALHGAETASKQPAA
jgi:pyridoxine kinase